MTTRREVLEAGIAAGTMMTLGTLGARAQERPLILKKIPSTGEELPPVGIGTNRYGVGTGEAERAPLRATLERFAQLGGKVVDTAPIYGTSESVIGDLVSELGIRDKLFLATKTDITGRTPAPESMRQSAQRLRTDVIDLMQVHNLVKVQESLAALRDWKAGGRIRYIGVTISTEDQFDELEQVMRRETLDFVQLNYSLDDRKAAERLLPLAQDRGFAVLLNLPFGSGGLFEKVQGRSLPDWAAEFDCESWGQFFLKYLIAHPAVTCAIPGTRQARHVIDNFGAARGRLPDEAMRRRQERFIDELS